MSGQFVSGQFCVLFWVLSGQFHVGFCVGFCVKYVFIPSKRTWMPHMNNQQTKMVALRSSSKTKWVLCFADSEPVILLHAEEKIDVVTFDLLLRRVSLREQHVCGVMARNAPTDCFLLRPIFPFNFSVTG